MPLSHVPGPAAIELRGVALLVLPPSGEIEIDGARRSEARLLVGGIDDPGVTEARFVAIRGEAWSQSENGGVCDA